MYETKIINNQSVNNEMKYIGHSSYTVKLIDMGKEQGDIEVRIDISISAAGDITKLAEYNAINHALQATANYLEQGRG